MDVFGARLVQSRACGFGLISGLADGSGMTDLGGCLLRFSSPARACARQYSMNNGLLPERACWIAFAWSSRQLPNFIIDFGRWRRWFPVVLISIENRPFRRLCRIGLGWRRDLSIQLRLQAECLLRSRVVGAAGCGGWRRFRPFRYTREADFLGWRGRKIAVYRCANYVILHCVNWQWDRGADRVKVRVDKSIPFPASAPRRSKWPWARMEVGDSFLIPGKTAVQCGGVVGLRNKRPGGKRFGTRTVAEGCRVWRLE